MDMKRYIVRLAHERTIHAVPAVLPPQYYTTYQTPPTLRLGDVKVAYNGAHHGLSSTGNPF